MSRLIRRRWESIAFLAILLLALGLRFYRLGAQSLWNDEGTSVALAQRDLATIARNAADDIHPPLYYILLHAWMSLAGTGEFAVRALSALAGAALVGGTYLLARRFFAPATAILAALLMALAPFQVYYSQEARMYALVSLFGLLSMMAYVGLLERGGPHPGPLPKLPGEGGAADGSRLGRSDSSARSARSAQSARSADSLLWATGYIVASLLALYTQYYAAAILLAQNVGFALWLGWGYGRRGRGEGARGGDVPVAQGTRNELNVPTRRLLLFWAGVQGVILLGYLPWLALAWRSLQRWPAVGERLSGLALAREVAQTFSLGVTVSGGPRTQFFALALSALVLPALIGSLVGRGNRAAPGGRAGAKHGAGGVALMALYLVVPVALMYGLSLQRPMYKPKLLLLATPPYYILQAQGIMVLGCWVRRLMRVRWPQAVVVAVVALGVCAASAWSLRKLYFDARFARDDYRGIVAAINVSAGPDDAILIDAPSQVETVNYYYHGALAEYPLPQQRPINTAHTQAALEAILARHARIYAILWATAESDPQRFIETWLDQRCFKAQDRWFGNLRLVIYAVPRQVAQPQTPAQRLDYTLGPSIRLVGYTLLNPTLRSGDIVQLTLYWQVLAPVPERYKVFTHVVDARGEIVGQRDSEPGGGARLTSDWQPGETIADNYGLFVPLSTPPGEHVLRVGMYGLNDGKRLPVTRGNQAAGDAIDLARLSVTP